MKHGDVIIQKLRWSKGVKRTKDFDDAVAVMGVQGETELDWPYIVKWCAAHETLEVLAEAKAEATPAWEDDAAGRLANTSSSFSPESAGSLTDCPFPLRDYWSGYAMPLYLMPLYLMWRFPCKILPESNSPHQHTIMKQLPVRITKARSGMTLIELTVVILVLLTLISILFVGAKAWKKGSDRAANVMNLRNVQQAVRGHANMNDILQADASVTPAIVGGAVTRVSIFGASDDGVGGYLRFPAQVATVSYTTPSQINTATGTLYLVAAASGLEGAAYGPKAGSTRDW